MKHVWKLVFATVFSLSAAAAFADGENEPAKNPETTAPATTEVSAGEQSGTPEVSTLAPEASAPAAEVSAAGGCGCPGSNAQ